MERKLTDQQTPGEALVEPSKQTDRRVRGGVNPTPTALAVHGLDVPTIPLVPRHAAPVAGAFSNFTFHGGPIVTHPQVYTSFWGSQWSDAAHMQRAAILNRFLQDLLKSDFMNVLSQYGIGTGNFIRSSFVNNIPANLTEKEIHQILQLCIDNGVLPEPTSNTALIIYLDEGIGVNDLNQDLILCEAQNDNAFGYHSFFVTAANNPFYYAVVPALGDTCLKETCSSDDTCSLHLSETQEQRLTQVTSHEFAELVTDPHLNSWFDPDPRVGENGDICNGESDLIHVGANFWTVQRIYSKFDDMHSNGAIFCLGQALTPKPRLGFGPSVPAASLSRLQQVTSVDGILPLPSLHFDMDLRRANMEEEERDQYVQKLFSPLYRENIMPDLPGLLRQCADILEKKKK
ncbi:MAG: hypothetical protein PVS3B3_33290 [Ktedonobacteraceae bacterium]